MCAFLLLLQVDYLLGKQAYFGKTDSEVILYQCRLQLCLYHLFPKFLDGVFLVHINQVLIFMKVSPSKAEN